MKSKIHEKQSPSYNDEKRESRMTRIKDMIVVTGGAGFIGSAIIWGLNRRGRSDILVIDMNADTEGYENLRSLNFAKYLDKKNFLDKLGEKKFSNEINGIIHMGACSDTTEKDEIFLMKNNYEYTKRLASWASTNDKRFLYASSAATYGMGENGFSDDHLKLKRLKPVNLYGKSKHRFDLWALEKGYLRSIAGLKYFNVFGPNEYHKGDMRSMVLKSFEQIQETGKVKLFKSNNPDYGDGEQVRDFIYVKDVVKMTLFIYDNLEVNGIINIGTGIARSFNDLVKAVFDSMDKKPGIEYIDMPGKLNQQYQSYTRADIAKLKALGYAEHISTLEEGIEDYLKNYLLKDNSYL